MEDGCTWPWFDGCTWSRLHSCRGGWECRQPDRQIDIYTILQNLALSNLTSLPILLTPANHFTPQLLLTGFLLLGLFSVNPRPACLATRHTDQLRAKSNSINLTYLIANIYLDYTACSVFPACQCGPTCASQLMSHLSLLIPWCTSCHAII